MNYVWKKNLQNAVNNSLMLTQTTFYGKVRNEMLDDIAKNMGEENIAQLVISIQYCCGAEQLEKIFILKRGKKVVVLNTICFP